MRQVELERGSGVAERDAVARVSSGGAVREGERGREDGARSRDLPPTVGERERGWLARARDRDSESVSERPD